MSPQLHRCVVSLLTPTSGTISQAFAGQVLEKVQGLVVSDISLYNSCRIFTVSIPDSAFSIKRSSDREGVSIISQPANLKKKKKTL